MMTTMDMKIKDIEVQGTASYCYCMHIIKINYLSIACIVDTL